jgi:hypothetical protein
MGLSMPRCGFGRPGGGEAAVKAAQSSASMRRGETRSTRIQFLSGGVTPSCWNRSMGDLEAVDAFVESPWCQAVLARMEAPGHYEAFESQARHVGNCAHPIRLKSHVVATDTAIGQRAVAFSSADTPDGVVYKACENRRSSRCAQIAPESQADRPVRCAELRILCPRQESNPQPGG